MTSLVLPAYNPGRSIEATHQSLREFLDDRRDPWDVVIVLDGCTDGTADRLADCATDRRIRVLSYATNRGKGFAVRTGLLAARGDYRLFTDIDLAYGFDDILRVAAALRHGAGAAIASRSHPESHVQLPAHLLGYAYRRTIQSGLFGRATRLLLPIRQTDTQAGLKGFTADVVRHILPMTTCDGFGFDCELLTACHYCGIPVEEVPVLVRHHDRASTTRSRTAFAMLRELWSIRRNWKHKTVPAYVAAHHETAPELKAA